MPPKKAAAWEPAWDYRNKKWYFQDRNTGIVSWEKPEGVIFDLPTAPPTSNTEAPTKPSEPCPPGWEAAWDLPSKRWYYFNRDTQERVWTFKPAAKTDTGAGGAGGSTQPGGGANPYTGDVGGGPGRNRTRPTGEWDAAEFLLRLREARSTGDIRAVKRVLVDVSESNYALRDRWRSSKTVMLPHGDLMRRMPAGGAKEPEISFTAWTTGDAIKHFATQRGRDVCALNFANGAQVGGGYKNGAIAQEEDLCRRCPTLYTSLNNAKRDGFYPFGPATCFSPERPEKYSYVLFTPDVVLARSNETSGYAVWAPDEQVRCSLVTAAAPNVKGKEVYDKDLMYNTIKSIFVAPPVISGRVNTLILGAWGCGVFGCDPRDVSELFARAIKHDRLGRLYQEIHFAIPSFDPSDTNGKIFLETLRKHKIDVREL